MRTNCRSAHGTGSTAMTVCEKREHEAAVADYPQRSAPHASGRSRNQADGGESDEEGASARLGMSAFAAGCTDDNHLARRDRHRAARHDQRQGHRRADTTRIRSPRTGSPASSRSQSTSPTIRRSASSPWARPTSPGNYAEARSWAPAFVRRRAAAAVSQRSPVTRNPRSASLLKSRCPLFRAHRHQVGGAHAGDGPAIDEDDAVAGELRPIMCLMGALLPVPDGPKQNTDAAAASAPQASLSRSAFHPRSASRPLTAARRGGVSLLAGGFFAAGLLVVFVLGMALLTDQLSPMACRADLIRCIARGRSCC
jgi:hypothetical protein